VTAFLLRSTQRFFHEMQRIRSLPKMQRTRIAIGVLADIRPYLQIEDAGDLQELRRYAQERRALLTYEGARDFTDVRFATATMTEQWAIAKSQLVASRSLAMDILAELRATSGAVVHPRVFCGI
jgi:hypothetical protein